MDDVIVSIIVPVYNTAQYLKECIDSIIHQTFQKWELILVDDGSKDDSGRICDRYAKEDRRIKVVHKENKGQGAARNEGLNKSQGRYITFVDSDDFFSQTVLEENVALFEKDVQETIDIIQYPCVVKYGTKQANKKYDREFCIMGGASLFQAWLVEGRIANYVWGKIFRRRLFESIRFKEDMYYEDRYIMCGLLQACHSFLSSGKGLYYYRSRPGQVVQLTDSLFVLQSKMNADLNIVRYTLPYPSLLKITLERYSNCLYYGSHLLHLGGQINGESLLEIKRLRVPVMKILGSSAPKGIRIKCVLSSLLGPSAVMRLYAVGVTEDR